MLPHCREFNLPLALMQGVKRAVNPQLKLAGDGSGLSNLGALRESLRGASGKQVSGNRAGAGKPA